ncbi:MAG: hypothetical protein JEZ00_10895 [Anaerolineaceae bacterium]|nr:hypothetical protein [Anaerolineaceae bacterium]
MILKNRKHSLTSSIVITVVGISGLLYAIFWLPRDNYQQGLIYGITSGLLLTGIIGIIYSIYLLRHPEKAKEASIQKDEERTQFIRMKTASSTSQLVLYAEALACLIIGFMGNKEISMVIAIILLSQLAIATIFSTYYSKKH